ncbi:MAG TPA: hypothetical protein VK178_07415, partial [Opitutaceae bacterium]|nr:hypothetical protein [Opitutaceae bacterium]
FDSAAPAAEAGPFALFRQADWLLGVASIDLDDEIERRTRGLYDSLFAATRGLHLARIWNYVPAINAPTTGGLETYRAFSRGRSLAFEAEFGPGFRRHVPAASAVGTDSDKLTVVFAATSRAPRHVENPRQVPAYEYPPEHGPRPPTFARATVVPAAAGRSDVFISGTSSILGHATIAPTETLPQLACTLENLRGISVACGSGADLAAGRAEARHFKVYLRSAADLPAVQAVLERELLRPEDRVSYLRSDICRRELNVEIEATLLGVALAR